MTRAHKKGSVRRRLGALGRPVLAAGLLAALAWAAIQGFHRSADATDNGRLADRLQVTRAAAASVGGWLDAGMKDAAAAAAQSAQTGAGSVAEAYSARPHVFRDLFVVDRGLRRTAGTQRFAASDNSVLACRDASGAVLDDGLRGLAQAALQTGGPVVRAFDDPTCAPAVGAAAAVPGGPVAIVLAERSSLLVRLESLAGLANGRTYVLEPGGQAVGSTVTPASELAGWVASQHAPEGARKVAHQDLVRSWAPLPAGWTLIVEQGANEFGGGGAPQSSNLLPAAIAACFAFAVVVVGVFDARRRKALARADEVRSSFLAVVSHELRTPLTVLKGFVDTLLARWDHLESEQRQQLVERLGPQVRRLHRGVDRLLIAADIQRGAHLRVTSEPVALAKVVGDVVDGFRPLAPLHTFEVHVPPEVSVVGDRKALTQALDQLVDNAVKYSPSGGAVTVCARRLSRKVMLTVEDEGVGLPSDTTRIFEPLTQGEDVDSRVHDEGGVGVGLYIARAMLEAMGGSVRAERRAPQPGARLVVTLVAGPPSQAGGEPVARTARVHGSS